MRSVRPSRGPLSQVMLITRHLPSTHRTSLTFGSFTPVLTISISLIVLFPLVLKELLISGRRPPVPDFFHRLPRNFPHIHFTVVYVEVRIGIRTSHIEVRRIVVVRVDINVGSLELGYPRHRTQP